MGYPLPPYRRQAPPPAPAPLPAPLLGEHLQEFADRPYGSHGETLVPRQPPPPAVESRPFTIPPPEWETEPSFGAPAPPPAPLPNALADLKVAAGDDDWPAFGLPVPPTPPLLPAKIPPWSEEERRQEELQRLRAAQGILEEQPRRHPPARREPV